LQPDVKGFQRASRGYPSGVSRTAIEQEREAAARYPLAIWPRPRTPLEVALAYLNTWDLLAPDPELLADPAELGRLLEWVHLRGAGALTRADVDRAVEARGRLRAAFEADSEDAAVAGLNAMAREVGVTPQLGRGPGGWVSSVAASSGDPVDGLIAESAWGLLSAVKDGLWDRLGICSADPCRSAYLDRTRNRIRRYCCALCADRAMHAAYRERRRGAAARAAS
jgi:predicted RNA-binding Zn ribbon-like protein